MHWLAIALLVTVAVPARVVAAPEFHFTGTVHVDAGPPLAVSAALAPGETKTVAVGSDLQLQLSAPAATDQPAMTAIRVLRVSSTPPAEVAALSQGGPPKRDISFTLGVCAGKVFLKFPAEPFTCESELARSSRVDEFSGTYRLVKAGEAGYLVVTAISEGSWDVNVSVKGGPLLRHRYAMGQPMILASAEWVLATFGDPAFARQASCLKPSLAQAGTFLCRVPTNIDFAFVQNFPPVPVLRSKTGYVLRVGPPNSESKFDADLVRTLQ